MPLMVPSGWLSLTPLQMLWRLYQKCPLALVALPFGVSIILASLAALSSGTPPSRVANYSAIVFVMVATGITCHDVWQYFSHWVRPNLQRYAVRILWMVPIYAVDSWLSFRFQRAALYIETLRESYESLVIYSFLWFLLGYLGGSEETQERRMLMILEKKPESRGYHHAGFQYLLTPWKMGQEFLWRCKFGVWQYVVIKIILMFLTFLFEFNGVYNEGELFNFYRGYAYITFAYSVSQVWAVYCLILFYLAFKEELEPINPFPKFLTVKAVVFFSFWQSVAIHLFVTGTSIASSVATAGPLRGHAAELRQKETDSLAKAIQDYLICIEMFVAAVGMHYAFPYADYSCSTVDKSSFLRAFKESTIPSDVVGETNQILAEVTSKPGQPLGVLDITLVMQEGILNVTSLAAHGLQTAESGRCVQPYCALSLMNLRGRRVRGAYYETAPVRALDPQWSDSIYFGKECDLADVRALVVTLKEGADLADVNMGGGGSSSSNNSAASAGSSLAPGMAGSARGVPLGEVLVHLKELREGVSLSLNIPISRRVPQLLATVPTDNETGVEVGLSRLTLEFDEAVEVGGSGEVQLRALADHRPVCSASACVDAAVDNRVVVKLPAAPVAGEALLQGLTEYYVRIAPGLVRDKGSAFHEHPGISDPSMWSFMTGVS